MWKFRGKVRFADLENGASHDCVKLACDSFSGIGLGVCAVSKLLGLDIEVNNRLPGLNPADRDG